jgi:hypothetical protein
VKEKFRLGRTSGANHQKFHPWTNFGYNGWISGDLFKGGFFLNDPQSLELVFFPPLLTFLELAISPSLP